MFEAGDKLRDVLLCIREGNIVHIDQVHHDIRRRLVRAELLPDDRPDPVQAVVLAFPQIEQHRPVGIGDCTDFR